METITEKISREKRIERQKKLERISIYFNWLDRGPEEAHITWEQWCKLRELRRIKDKIKSIKRKQYYKSDNIYYTTSYGKTSKN